MTDEPDYTETADAAHREWQESLHVTVRRDDLAIVLDALDPRGFPKIEAAHAQLHAALEGCDRKDTPDDEIVGESKDGKTWHCFRCKRDFESMEAYFAH